MSNLIKRCVSGLSLKDFVPPVCGKIAAKFRNCFHVVPTKQRSAHFLYLPEDYSPDFVLDVGAATGFTAFAALRTFDTIPVHCVEPLAANVEILKKSIALYPHRAFIHTVALSDHEGEMEFNVMSSPYANSLFELPEDYMRENPQIKIVGKQIVRVETLDSFGKKSGLSGKGMIKLDVEGAELDVLKGGSEFIREHVSAIIVELAFNRGIEYVNQVMSKLSEYGFVLVNVFDVNRSTHNSNVLVQLDAVYIKK